MVNEIKRPRNVKMDERQLDNFGKCPSSPFTMFPSA
jgi:hypothetical protein